MSVYLPLLALFSALFVAWLLCAPDPARAVRVWAALSGDAQAALGRLAHRLRGEAALAAWALDTAELLPAASVVGAVDAYRESASAALRAARRRGRLLNAIAPVEDVERRDVETRALRAVVGAGTAVRVLAPLSSRGRWRLRLEVLFWCIALAPRVAAGLLRRRRWSDLRELGDDVRWSAEATVEQVEALARGGADMNELWGAVEAALDGAVEPQPDQAAEVSGCA